MPFGGLSGAGVAFGIVGRKSAVARARSGAGTALETAPVVEMASDVGRWKYHAPTASPANSTATETRVNFARRGFVDAIARVDFPAVTRARVAPLRPACPTVLLVLAMDIHEIGPFASTVVEPVYELTDKGIFLLTSLLVPGSPTSSSRPDCFALKVNPKVRGEVGEGIVGGARCSPSNQISQYWVQKANGRAVLGWLSGIDDTLTAPAAPSDSAA